METIGIILLAIIAYYIWKIYKQREEERQQIADEKFEVQQERDKKEEFKDYPHLIGNVNYIWLELFGKLYIEKNIPHLKAAFMIYFKEANNTKLDIMEVDGLFYSLWDISEELLEHLEKYHESSKHEFEIAIVAYWQIVAEKAEDFVGKDIETIKEMFQSAPFTDIEKIPFWFPKKSDHPTKEISFTKEDGTFPRESKGSTIIQKRLKDLGL